VFPNNFFPPSITDGTFEWLVCRLGALTWCDLNDDLTVLAFFEVTVPLLLTWMNWRREEKEDGDWAICRVRLPPDCFFDED